MFHISDFMTCYFPLTAYRSIKRDGKSVISFNPLNRDVFKDLEIKLPCGRCVGCRLDRSRQWAIRCMHESSLHDSNYFVTLTYDDDHLPRDGSLDVRDFQLFMKKLRKKFGSKIRFYHCGEYGTKFGRPHYHAIIYNLPLSDLKLWKVERGNRLMTSKILTDIWGKGYVVVGDVTFESAAYVARYIMKKVLGDAADSHYERVNMETGEIYHIKPEYTTMSRRPGIAAGWFEKYHLDTYKDDSVVQRGMKMKPPRYYDNLFEARFPSDFEKIKKLRIRKSRKKELDNTPERLESRHQVQLAKLLQLKRTVE